jgi:hypothetical protein
MLIKKMSQLEHARHFISVSQTAELEILLEEISSMKSGQADPLCREALLKLKNKIELVVSEWKKIPSLPAKPYERRGKIKSSSKSSSKSSKYKSNFKRSKLKKPPGNSLSPTA